MDAFFQDKFSTIEDAISIYILIYLYLKYKISKSSIFLKMWKMWPSNENIISHPQTPLHGMSLHVRLTTKRLLRGRR